MDTSKFPKCSHERVSSQIFVGGTSLCLFIHERDTREDAALCNIITVSEKVRGVKKNWYDAQYETFGWSLLLLLYLIFGNLGGRILICISFSHPVLIISY